MSLPLRITFKNKDYSYKIDKSSAITRATTNLVVILNGDTVELKKDAKSVWVQKEGSKNIDPELAQAVGQSVSLRFRL